MPFNISINTYYELFSFTGRRKLAQIVIKDHFGHVTPNRENKMTYKSGTPRPDTSVP